MGQGSEDLYSKTHFAMQVLRNSASTLISHARTLGYVHGIYIALQSHAFKLAK